MGEYNFDQLIEPLQEWFREHARRLPWRDDPQAYYVWVSEIMLQQTRVEAVKPYFERFVHELPDVAALAACPDDRLMKLWEGLGYYNRVRNMKCAAMQMVEHYGGRVSEEYEQLLTLPGIGSYTAGAICSIAYGRPHPAVDGNVLRVLMRVTGDNADIGRQSVRSGVEARLQELMLDYPAVATDCSDRMQMEAVSQQDDLEDTMQVRLYPGVFNQALMELGALVCVPNGEPHCMECPWQEFCIAYQQDRISELPVRSKPKARRVEERTVLVIREGERVALHKRPQKGLLAGLYELPNCEGYLDADAVVSYIKGMGYEPLRVRPLTDAKHIFSHVEWHMRGYAVWISDRETTADEPWLFVEAQDAQERYAIPSAFARYAQYLNIQLGV